MNIGVLGRVKCVKKAQDGVELETFEFDNMILDSGLNLLGSGSGSIMDICQIGSGNTAPSESQTSLVAFIGEKNKTSTTYSYDYTPSDLDYRVSETTKYAFTGLSNKNITELGLKRNNSGEPHLATRALIKDSAGNPTTITILTGEVLEIYYTLTQVFSKADTTYRISVLDKNGNAELYDATVRLGLAGSAIGYKYVVGLSLGFKETSIYLYNTGLSEINASESGYITYTTGNANTDIAAYAANTFKRIVNIKVGLSAGNITGGIRKVLLSTTMGTYQIEFTKVSDGTALAKTNQKVLTIPVEFSWGRYEPTSP
ncbi:hypothetical protein [Psychrobacter sp. MES7-P7E]|uniref:hypothetical protein n=1 Tax=Psychrobacter sp. MES7-P7E TaxID=2058322 RepID=UPI000C7F02F6|nr:hypothetical protein [Psychrobacter sp. MES7-P7E]PLT21146.1 hypothetical protein CXF62_11645 [Psychrobacter sp. MES7-P7E]